MKILSIIGMIAGFASASLHAINNDVASTIFACFVTGVIIWCTKESRNAD